MDAIFGMSQGVATWVLALGLGSLVLGTLLLTSGRRRREKQEHGSQNRVLALVLIVAGAIAAILGAILWITALTTGG